MWNPFKNNPYRHFRDVLSSGFNDSNKEVFILKHPLEAFNTNTRIQVNVGELAVFVENGKIVQIIEPSNEPVKTSNFPFFSNFMSILQGGVRSNTCSLYFVKTTPQTPPLNWASMEAMPLMDPQYNNTMVEIGGYGTFTFTIQSSNLQHFFLRCSGTSREAYTYDDVCLCIAPEMSETFFEGITSLINKYQRVEGINHLELTTILKPIIEDVLLQEFGLTLVSFKTAKINVITTEQREAIKQAITNVSSERIGIIEGAKTGKEAAEINKEEAIIRAETEDITEKKRIEREDMQERMRIARETAAVLMMKEAEANGKLKELNILGDDWLKLKISEIAETALSNPAIAQIGTSALGGFLGTHSDVFGNLVKGLVGGLEGNNSTQSSSLTLNNASNNKANDFIPASAIQSENNKTNPFAPTSSIRINDETEKIIEQLTQMYLEHQISAEFYNSQLEKLKKNEN